MITASLHVRDDDLAAAGLAAAAAVGDLRLPGLVDPRDETDLAAAGLAAAAAVGDLRLPGDRTGDGVCTAAGW